jgi:hypothetical protein
VQRARICGRSERAQISETAGAQSARHAANASAIDFDLRWSCVIPDQALMREDLLDCLELTDVLDRLFGNVGTGGDVDIKELAPICGKNRLDDPSMTVYETGVTINVDRAS